ncbi:MAG: iron-sulfur cluster assembly scaffold protein [Patescibacteria group bacterium]|nr:MAG: iron-sulfur cluster assembly scaffold protein [Patescibacteria group bacterium]
MDIYKEIILDRYKNPKHFGKLKRFTVSITVDNPLCGDKITVYLVVNNGRIETAKFKGSGCIISLSSADILLDDIIGKQISEVLSYNKDNVLSLLGIELGVNRLKCALLPLEAVHKAINKLEI